jgi:hypothetical protein
MVGIIVLTGMVQIATATTRYVDASPHTPVSPFTSWATAATNIQDAINVAGYGGDTILVNDGVYKSGSFVGGSIWGGVSARIFSLGKPLTIQSVNGPEVTIIKGQSGLACAHLIDQSVLSGFTLMNSTNYIVGYAGGVVCYSTNCLVTNCIIANNYCGGGGGSSGGISRGTVIDCVVSNNQSFCGGAVSNVLINCTLISNNGSTGGAYRSSLTNCLLVGNIATSFGGGAAALSILKNCTVSNNAATTGANGGGLYFCTANDSLISSNRTSSGSGGGAYSSGLSNCVVQNNFSFTDGGGAYAGALTNCTIANNSVNSGRAGGGVANATLNQCLVTGNKAQIGTGVANCTGNNCIIAQNFAAGSGSGAGAYGSTLNNCIIYYNQAVTNADILSCVLANCCTPSLAYPNISNSFTNDPRFVDPSGDFHLQSDSPCINAGKNSFMAGTNDLDGNPRIVGDTVDVGAYEYQYPSSVLSYAWLQQYNLPTDGSVDFADDDADGMTTWQEWIAGTDPTDVSSLLQMYSATPTNNPAGVFVSWQSVGGKNYLLQRSSNLTVFQNVRSNIVGLVGITVYRDTNAVGSGPFFYRTAVQ